MGGETAPASNNSYTTKLENQNKIILCYNRKSFEKVELYEEDRFLNMLVLGPSGTGKSSQIFLPLIYQDIINEGCGVTIIDPKEDLAEEAYAIASRYSPRKVIYMDPIDIACPRINPFNGTTQEIITTLSKIFTSGIVKSSDEKASMDMIRILISKSITLIKEYPLLVSNNLNIKTFSNFISNKNGQARMDVVEVKEMISKKNKESELIEICEWFRAQFFAPDSRANEMCYDFKMKIEEIASNEYLSRILTPSGIDSEVLNFDESIARGDVVIINTRYSLLGHMSKTFGEFLLRLYMTSVFKRRHYQVNRKIGNYLKPNFLYIDEFATFAPISTDLFTQGRSFRVGTHISTQNRSLLKVCGEQDSSAQAVIIEANTRNLVLFPGMEGNDAKYYSEQFFNLSAQEILYRPFGQIVYRIVQKRSISPPNVGLVFFVDETPHAKSLAKEYTFDKEGNLLPNEYIDDEDDEGPVLRSFTTEAPLRNEQEIVENEYIEEEKDSEQLDEMPFSRQFRIKRDD